MKTKLWLKAITVISLLFACIQAQAQPVDYWRSDSVKVMRLLHKAKEQKQGTNFMIFFARQFLGLPYVAKTLEKNDDERLVVNLRQLDCTTFVETVTALTRCMQQEWLTFAAYCDNLRQIRYRGGVVSYPNRLHYFTAWINDNVRKGIVRDILGPNPPFTAVQHVRANYMTTHVSLYPMLVKHPEWIPEIKKMEDSITGRNYRYIPRAQLTNSKLLRATVHDGDIVAYLTSRQGLDTSHLAIALWQRDGLHFIDASAVRHKVVVDKLISRYMAEHPSHLGIRIVSVL